MAIITYPAAKYDLMSFITSPNLAKEPVNKATMTGKATNIQSVTFQTSSRLAKESTSKAMGAVFDSNTLYGGSNTQTQKPDFIWH